ncbi:MAG: hypothetical protein H7322_15740 [Ramlibacter sp.]|nr:hypothetical protein [Ramlibacter sp.]
MTAATIWFDANLTGQRFAPGRQLRGQMTAKDYQNVVLDLVIDKVEREQLLSSRWRPHCLD